MRRARSGDEYHSGRPTLVAVCATGWGFEFAGVLFAGKKFELLLIQRNNAEPTLSH